MKLFTNIVKLLTALAAVAGAIYVIATYGDEIVAWAKKTLASWCPCSEAEPIADDPEEETVAADTVSEENPVEGIKEVPVEEEIVAPAVQEPVAEENDFAE